MDLTEVDQLMERFLDGAGEATESTDDTVKVEECRMSPLQEPIPVRECVSARANFESRKCRDMEEGSPYHFLCGDFLQESQRVLVSVRLHAGRVPGPDRFLNLVGDGIDRFRRHDGPVTIEVDGRGEADDQLEREPRPLKQLQVVVARVDFFGGRRGGGGGSAQAPGQTLDVKHGPSTLFDCAAEDVEDGKHPERRGRIVVDEVERRSRPVSLLDEELADREEGIARVYRRAVGLCVTLSQQRNDQLLCALVTEYLSIDGAEAETHLNEKQVEKGIDLRVERDLVRELSDRALEVAITLREEVTARFGVDGAGRAGEVEPDAGGGGGPTEASRARQVGPGFGGSEAITGRH